MEYNSDTTYLTTATQTLMLFDTADNVGQKCLTYTL